MIDNFAKGGKYYETYKHVISFHKGHEETKSDADWQRLAIDLDVLNKKYPGDTLLVDMLDVVMKEIKKNELAQ